MAASYPGAASPLLIPHYVKARTPEGLKRAMLQNNLKFKAYCNYSNIQFVDGNWYAWFTVDLNLSERLKK